ncbi:TIGR03088 family PEP-CTERM/XrtA system glycosyltransferase [Thalassotalea euphylliae]|uniref:TIGR03088 family PEP-CTERM/XrtA system glycosyltransferase n=1 Tax=Thalassotalea euphylliae TaxID=1655234 RepID=UPI00363268EE
MNISNASHIDKSKIHVAHIVYSFATGGLENGVVNLINNLPQDRYHHSIVCITDHDASFVARINTDNYQIFDLHKSPGRGLSWLYRCWKLLSKLKPDICHSRNLNPLEAQVAAFAAGIKARVHGEHGWDTSDIGGTNTKYQTLRKIFKPFIHQYVALSSEARDYLIDKIHVSPSKVNHICNGVNIERFSPDNKASELPNQLKGDGNVVFGTVGRLAEVKNQTFLLEAFIALKQEAKADDAQAKLLIVGDGVLMADMKQRAAASGFEQDICFTGLRTDIPELMANMDVFVLPSLAEGISNTILEAMASGLPVVATKVGGNPDLIMPKHQDSHLVAVNNVEALQTAMEQYTKNRENLSQDSVKAREHCVKHFSIQSMVGKYHDLYETLYKQVDRK